MVSERTPLLSADSSKRRWAHGAGRPKNHPPAIDAAAPLSVRERRRSPAPPPSLSEQDRGGRRLGGNANLRQRQHQQRRPPPMFPDGSGSGDGDGHDDRYAPRPQHAPEAREGRAYSPPRHPGADGSSSSNGNYDRWDDEDVVAATGGGGGDFRRRNGGSRSASPRGRGLPEQRRSRPDRRTPPPQRRRSRGGGGREHDLHLDGDRPDYHGPRYNEGANRMAIAEGMGAGRPVLPASAAAPDEVLAVRAAALTVLTPLTLAWPIVSTGFAAAVGLGLARRTELLPHLPLWAAMLPAWLSHLGLLCCHVVSARALSSFVAGANEDRRRGESTDHLDRAEYLPLLQRSLKFGLKTGALSLCAFAFEVLVYIHAARGTVTLAAALTPMWIVAGWGVLDGIICKTQHALRVLCWALLLASMVLLVLRVDAGLVAIRWRVVVSPLVGFLSVSSASLMYVVYGHQVGYYRLSESQLTAGILYSMAALLSVILVVLMGDFVPYLASDEIETRLFVVGLGPTVVLLVGMGAWAVSRDEFDRLLRHGGQAAVHPMKLRLEPEGWTAAEGRGVTVLPMFGEVEFEPLNKSTSSKCIELCPCCACYPYEEEDDAVQYREPPQSSARQRYPTAAGIPHRSSSV